MKYEFSREDETKVTEGIIALGIPAHLKGYHYIRTAVLIAMQDSDSVTSVSKLLYPEIAKIHKVSDQRVERAIRNAIEVVWNRNEEHFKEFFKNQLWETRPTNSEFIACFVEILNYYF